MVQILLPEAFYAVTTSARCEHVASHCYWHLELELRVDDTRLPLRNVETDTAVQRLSGSLFVSSIRPVDGSDFHAVGVGNQLVAVNDTELGTLNVLEMHRLLQAATEHAPTHLLFLRHDYADANVALHHMRPPLLSPFEVATFTHNDVAWYFSPSYALFADTTGHRPTLTWTSRAWQLWREAQTRLRSSLYSWDEIALALEEKMWQHLCANLLDEYLWPQMKIPYIAHLNLNNDARDALYCHHFTTPSLNNWGLELAVQAPYALTTTSLSSTSKGIVVVTKAPTHDQLAVMAGDILVAINHSFLTTTIPSARKKLQRVASQASRLHPASLLFLRYEHFGSARHLTSGTALPPVPLSIPDLLSSLYPPALDTAIVERLPLQVDALQWLFSEANAFTTHRIQNQLWYAHHKSKRVFAEHPLRILLYPVIEATRRRLLWTVRWVEWRWQRRVRLLAAVDAVQERVLHGFLEAAINVCIERLYTPVVIAYARRVVEGTITSVLDDVLRDEEQLFVASLHRFRFLHRDTDLEPTKPLPTHTVVRRQVPRRVGATTAVLDVGPAPEEDPLNTLATERLLNVRATFASVQATLRLRNVATGAPLLTTTTPARSLEKLATDDGWMSSPNSTVAAPMLPKDDSMVIVSTHQETGLLTTGDQINGTVFGSYSDCVENAPVGETTMDRFDSDTSTMIRPPTPRDVPRTEPEASMGLLPLDTSVAESSAMHKASATSSDIACPESQWIKISDAAMPLQTDDISPTMSINGRPRVYDPLRLDDSRNVPATALAPMTPPRDTTAQCQEVDLTESDDGNGLLMEEVDRIIEFQPECQVTPAVSTHGARRVSMAVNIDHDHKEQQTPEAMRSEALSSVRRRSIPPLVPHPVVVQPWHLSVPTPTLAAWQQKNTATNIRSQRAIPRLQLDKLPVRAWNDGNAKTKKKAPRRKPSLQQMQAATRIQACFRGYHCRMAYRIKRDKLRRRADARTRLGALSPFLNARPERFPRISTRTVVQGERKKAAATHKQDSETSFLRTQLTDREEELMEELKSLNQALEARRKAHAAPRLPLLGKTTSLGAK